MDVLIRNMREADVPRVSELEVQCYSVPWSEATFRGLLRRRDADLVVAEHAHRLVGYAVFWQVLDQGELGNVAVEPESRRLGVARRLVHEVVARATARGVRELFLEVRPSNGGARQLYESFGFAPVGRRPRYYQEPVEDAVVMRVSLPRVGPTSGSVPDAHS